MTRVNYNSPDDTQPQLDTTTALGSNGVFVTGAFRIDGSQEIRGTIFANQAGTIYIEQSFDQNNWDCSNSYAITANDGKGFKESVVADYARVRYVNGSSAQTTLRLHVYYR
jgi:hypothetical protein